MQQPLPFKDVNGDEGGHLRCVRGGAPVVHGKRRLVSGPDAPARAALHRRFAGRLAVRDDLNRRLVSYQANKAQPGLRWFKYKEGNSPINPSRSWTTVVFFQWQRKSSTLSGLIFQ